MKKLITITILVIFLLSLFPLPALAAEKVCCAKSKSGSYCSFASEDQCDTSAAVKTKAGFTASPFACAQLNDCKPVCCITETGVCSEKISKAQCRAQKGIPIDSANCQIPECEKGACIISNQCNFPTTAETCKRKAQDLKVKFIFDNSIKSLNECNTKYSVEEGCCVLSNACSRATGEQCTLQKGTFYPGKLCSNSELVGQCRGHTPQYAKQCTKEGDVYWVDSRGVLENVLGSPNDGLIHNREADIKGRPGDCDLAASTACSKDSQGELACINVDCNAGSIMEAKGLVQFNPKLGEVFAQQHTITQEDLGGAAARKNGETWCMTPGPAEPSKPGSVHQVYTCRLGKVIAESCGDFRVKVCQQETKGDKPSARCVDNQWEDCWLLQGGDRKQQAFYPKNKVKPKDVSKEKECALLGGSEFSSLSHCALKEGGRDECLPRYPPGFQFWKSASQDIMNKQRVCTTICGAGKLNSCDRNECSALGDCGNFDEGIGKLAGLGIGTVSGFIAGLGANHLLNVGTKPGGFWGWLGGQAVKEGAKKTAGATIKALSKEVVKTVFVGTATEYANKGLTQLTKDGKTPLTYQSDSEIVIENPVSGEYIETDATTGRLKGGQMYEDAEGRILIESNGNMYNVLPKDE